MIKKDWEKKARLILKGELARHDINYDELAKRLRSISVEASPQNLSNKINRGTFSAAFFLQCLHVVGINNLRIND